MSGHVVADSREPDDATVLLGDPDLVVDEKHVTDEVERLGLRVQLRQVGHFCESGQKDIRHGLGVTRFCPSRLHDARLLLAVGNGHPCPGPRAASPYGTSQEFHIKPLTWSKRSRGPALVDGVALGLEQRMVLGSDGGSD